jgi:hypothetical protein
VVKPTSEILERPASIWLHKVVAQKKVHVRGSMDTSDSDSDSDDSPDSDDDGSKSTFKLVQQFLMRKFANCIPEKVKMFFYELFIKISRLSKKNLDNVWFSVFRVIFATCASILVAYEVTLKNYF